MNASFSSRLLPFLTLVVGGIGFALYRWLLSGIDEKGLLQATHPAGPLLFLLSALMLAVLFFLLRTVPPTSKYAQLFLPSGSGALGCVFGAAALVYTSVAEGFSNSDIFSLLLFPIGIAAGIVLFFTAYCRYKGLRPQFFLTCVPVIYMILRLISLCRVWGTEPQLLLFLFPLLACMFLLLTCYQHCALTLQCGSRRQFLFYNQAALFFCCLSFGTQMWVFFLGTAIWMVADMGSLYSPRHLRRHKEA